MVRIVFQAVEVFSPECALILIEHGASTDVWDNHESTPIHIATVNKKPSIIAVICHAHGNLNIKDKVEALDYLEMNVHNACKNICISRVSFNQYDRPLHTSRKWGKRPWNLYVKVFQNIHAHQRISVSFTLKQSLAGFHVHQIIHRLLFSTLKIGEPSLPQVAILLMKFSEYAIQCNCHRQATHYY